ncbi:hypothetical protein [Pseudomonas sp. lyk4-TYG-107]|uniref:hypothetical protein n=1 Tax=Pseudomonas sp. lyk4-TYG-107 TaxID=3040317 RepID=UPI0025539767|nr:hypothetical protein [Pseudomonas sp. lyk4-TYG-107]
MKKLIFVFFVVVLSGCCSKDTLKSNVPLSAVVSTTNAAVNKILALKQWDKFSAENDHFKNSCTNAKKSTINACKVRTEASYVLCQSASHANSAVRDDICRRIMASDKTLCGLKLVDSRDRAMLDPRALENWCNEFDESSICSKKSKIEGVTCAAADNISGISLTKAELQVDYVKEYTGNGEIKLVVVNVGGGRTSQEGQTLNLELVQRPLRTAYTAPETLSTWSPRKEAQVNQQAIDKKVKSLPPTILPSGPSTYEALDKIKKDDALIQRSADEIVKYVESVLDATLAKYESTGDELITPLRPKRFTVNISYKVVYTAEAGLHWDFTHTVGTADVGGGITNTRGNILSLTFGPEN